MKYVKVIAIMAMMAWGFAHAQWTDGDNTTFGLAWQDSPTDSVHYMMRHVIAGMDLDEDGFPEIIATDYQNGGRVHVFEVTGNNTMEEVWTFQGTGGTYSTPARSVQVGNLDGDEYPEIILAMTGGSGDTSAAHVGIFIFEWNGTDNSYGDMTDPSNPQPTAVISATMIDPTLTRLRCEDLAVGDVDNDGVQEVIWTNNGANAEDNMYIMSVIGEFPGFWSVNVEQAFYRTVDGFGGSLIGSGVYNIDNDPDLEIVLSIWNKVGIAIIEAVAPDTYAINYHVESLCPVDAYIYHKVIFATDIDEDGNTELVLFPIYSGYAYIVNYTGDSATTTVDTVVLPSDLLGVMGASTGDQDHGPGADGKDIYLLVDGLGLIDLEYVGGDPADTANYEAYRVDSIIKYWGGLIDTIITVDTTIDTTVTPPETTIVVDTTLDSLTANYIVGYNPLPGMDLDGDGHKEIIADWYYTTEDPINLPDPGEGYLRVYEWGTTGIEEWHVISGKSRFIKNFPNPVKDVSTLKFNVPRKGFVDITLYDISGRAVKKIFSGELDAGTHTITWRADKFRAGVYILRLKTTGGSATTKVTITR